jgi:hypothetical protein
MTELRLWPTMETRPTTLLAAVIIGGFLMLGFAYSIVVPVFEAPDEAQHFFFVRELVEGHGLPVQQPGVRARWAQEGSQPPLYYMLGAALTFWVDASDWQQFAQRNPYAVQGDPLADGSRNVFLHGPHEAVLSHGTALALHLLRWLSLVLGALGVVVTYRVARLLFPERPHIALAAALVQAFLPQFVFISAAANNDALSALACAMVVWQALRVAKGASSRRADVLLGVLVGLAALSKLSGAAMSLVAFVAVLLASAGAERRSWQVLLRRLLWVAMPAMAVAGWWYARNVLLYADITGLNRMLALVGTRNPAPDLWQLLDESEGLRLSFWGVFGWFSILLPRVAYQVFDIIALVALTGLLIAVARAIARGASRASPHWSPHMLLPLTLIIVLAGVLRWGALTPGLQGRLLFPAITPIAILLSAGFAAWMDALHAAFPRFRAAAIAPFGLLLAFPMAAVLALPNVALAYARPELLASDGSAVIVRWTGPDSIILTRVEAPAQPLHPGDDLPLALFWRTSQPVTQDYTLYLKVYGRNDELIASVDTYPGNGMFPTTLWPASMGITDRYRLRISPSARVPVYAKVVAGFYEHLSGQALPPYSADGWRIVRPVVARVKVWPAGSPPLVPTHVMDANFGGQLTLRGYDIGPDGVTLYWQALRAPSADYTVFVHALDQSGNVVAQGDSQPQGAEYPTSVWTGGEQVTDLHAMAVPKQAVRLEIGLYLLQTGARLPLDGRPGDAVVVDLSR